MRGSLFQLAVDLHIAEREGLRVGGPLERDPGAPADAAVRAVAADQVAGAHLLGRSVVQAERAEDLLPASREGEQLDAPLHRDSVREQVLVHDRLRLGLRDEEQKRVGRVLETDVEQRHSHDACAEMHLEPESVVATLNERLGEPEPAQHLERARLHRERA